MDMDEEVMNEYDVDVIDSSSSPAPLCDPPSEQQVPSGLLWSSLAPPQLVLDRIEQQLRDSISDHNDYAQSHSFHPVLSDCLELRDQFKLNQSQIDAFLRILHKRLTNSREINEQFITQMPKKYNDVKRTIKELKPKYIRVTPKRSTCVCVCVCVCLSLCLSVFVCVSTSIVFV